MGGSVPKVLSPRTKIISRSNPTGTTPTWHQIKDHSYSFYSHLPQSLNLVISLANCWPNQHQPIMPSPDPDISEDYYSILNIPSSSTGNLPIISKQQLKNAYHKALLKHHPDKSSPSPSPTPAPGGREYNTYTIDDITNAYKVLSDPELRAEYDRDLILQRKSFTKVAGKSDDVSFHTGLEIVDLEDMIEQDDETTGSSSWYRGCRCGDEKGFIVTEDELEAEAHHGEILVGCRGCSLWIKVLFAVEEDQQEDEGILPKDER